MQIALHIKKIDASITSRRQAGYSAICIAISVKNGKMSHVSVRVRRLCEKAKASRMLWRQLSSWPTVRRMRKRKSRWSDAFRRVDCSTYVGRLASRRSPCYWVGRFACIPSRLLCRRFSSSSSQPRVRCRYFSSGTCRRRRTFRLDNLEWSLVAWEACPARRQSISHLNH